MWTPENKPILIDAHFENLYYTPKSFILQNEKGQSHTYMPSYMHHIMVYAILSRLIIISFLYYHTTFHVFEQSLNNYIVDPQP